MIVSGFNAYSQCEIPQTFTGNTGSNMTIMLTTNFINSLTITSPDAYVVATTPNNMVVGSVNVFDITQTSLAIWGDDSDSSELDGASSGEEITLQLVDGLDLYNLTIPVAITYSTNGMLVQGGVSVSNLCLNDNVGSTDCDYPGFYTGNTGANMTIMLTTGFLSSLQITDENAYISVSSDGMLVGSVSIYGIPQTSLAIWGDDSSTPEVDGAASGVNVVLELVDGTNLYTLNTDDIAFVVNGAQIMLTLDSQELTCGEDYIVGCMEEWAENFNPNANGSNDSCELTGCMDSEADNYIELANIPGDCIYYGCTNVNACNYNNQANSDDESCFFNEVGYDCDAVCLIDTDEDGICDEFEVLGCTDATANNFNQEATDDDETCTYTVYGCTDEAYLEFDSAANFDDNSCVILIVLGCTDLMYIEYNLYANTDDGSCLTPNVYGCTDSAALNFDANANTNDDSCEFLTFTGDWPSSPAGITNTGNNATIAITGDLNLDNGDYLGAFYESDGELVCAGLLIWDADAVNQLIIVWGNDEYTDIIDGVVSGEQIIWKSRDISEDSETSLYPIYSIGTNTYLVNAAYVISDWILNPIFGCMDAEYQEYNSSVLVNDGSCSMLWSSLYADQVEALANTILSYETQIANLISTHSLEIAAINASHDLIIEGLNNDAAITANAALVLLNQTIENYILDLDTMELGYESQLTSLIANYENTISILNADDASEDISYEEHISSLQSDSTQFELDLSIVNSTIESLNTNIANLQADNIDLSENLTYHSAPLYVDLAEGWNMIGFALQEEMDAAASLEILGDAIHLIKDNNAAVYWPEFGFNSLSTLVPGQGYQIRMYESYEQYTFPYISGERLDVYPQVPIWAIDMEIPSHPNDTPTLVRVVNMLGQEVNPEEAFGGEVLLYLFSNGTVEKTIK